MASYCKGCGAEIKWITTKKGKNMPVNPELCTSADCDEGEFLFAETGECVKVRAGVEAQGYVPHWSTCPKTDEFRKGR